MYVKVHTQQTAAKQKSQKGDWEWELYLDVGIDNEVKMCVMVIS